MRLRRPYIPLCIRIQVAERQLADRGKHIHFAAKDKLSSRLNIMLGALFGLDDVELHHRPALVNRQRNSDGTYKPAANNPQFLVYLPKHDHEIETRVRGVGAQRSDLGQRRYDKKVAKNRSKDPKRTNRWPKGRKLRSRAINPGWRRRRVRKGKEPAHLSWCRI